MEIKINMELTSIYGIVNYDGVEWTNTGRCGWCDCKIQHNEKEYLQHGNICNKCRTMINEKHEEAILEERIKRMKEKEQEIEELGKLLNQELTEDQRIRIVVQMERLHKEVKHTKIDLDI